MKPRNNNQASTRRVRSALWAAYGDILGFPTELVDAAGARRRIGADRISKPVSWKRRVGGRFGVTIELPEGCYSDDTQLRLSTSRAIRSDGTFDVEAFAKIELPVWSSYALGGGRGTKAAAAALAKRSTNWVANFGADGAYVRGGGNGAAMRVQPHAWASRDGASAVDFLPAVIRNSLCTHGHFRGIVGACFHALLVSEAVTTGDAPSPESWYAALDVLQTIPELINTDDEIRQFWVPGWEKLTGATVTEACNDVIGEMATDVSMAVKIDFSRPTVAYDEAVAGLGATRPDWRGSGTRTALLAALIAHLYADDPETGVLTAANALGTDTDTIATMAGALLGPSAKQDPPGQILDEPYIAAEALRTASISAGASADSFPYPDLLRWVPPRSQLDAVGRAGDRMAVVGLGYAAPRGELHLAPSHPDQGWQIVKTDIGQSLLIKRRAKLDVLPPTTLPYSIEMDAVVSSRDAGPTPPQRLSVADQPQLFDERRRAEHEPPVSAALGIPSNGTVPEPLTLHDATKLAWSAQLDPAAVGTILLSLASRDDGIELAMGFAAIIAKAKKTQEERERRNS
jgi:ADP-ribosylglycohydrolase